MKLFVIDASVAVKWYIPEPLSDRAVECLETAQHGRVALLSPDLVISELGNVLWKKHQRGELTLDEARTIAGILAASSPTELVSSSELLPAALEVAVAYGITVYDGLYVALAAAREATLVTADRGLHASVKGTAFGELVELLE